MIVSIYASLLALLFVALSFRTIRLRRKLRIAIGENDNELMTRAIRVHGNFSEYVPLALILAILLELSTDYVAAVHFVCILLVVGRCTHAFGLSQKQENFRFRVAGMALTFTSIITGALFLLAHRLFLA